jgi:hypothetical protein
MNYMQPLNQLRGQSQWDRELFGACAGLLLKVAQSSTFCGISLVNPSFSPEKCLNIGA